MIKIMRLLEYNFPDKDSAIRQLKYRGVKGTVSWGNPGAEKTSITETFYWTETEAGDVLTQVVTPVIEGEPPDGSK